MYPALPATKWVSQVPRVVPYALELVPNALETVK